MKTVVKIYLFFVYYQIGYYPKFIVYLYILSHCIAIEFKIDIDYLINYFYK